MDRATENLQRAIDYLNLIKYLIPLNINDQFDRLIMFYKTNFVDVNIAKQNNR